MDSWDQNYAYYYTLKYHSRKRIVNSINNKVEKMKDFGCWGKLSLSTIDSEAIEYARLEWPKFYGTETHGGFPFSWERLFHKFRNRPSFFDIAVWQIVDGKRVLQGMALGRPSNRKTHLSINWVERSFAPTYLKSGVLWPILACAEEYAKLLGCQRVLIRDAVDPHKYERYGYERRRMKFVGPVLIKELNHG
jgi:hypothetical protein